MTDKRILQVGLIGNGKSANRYHAPFLLQRRERFCIKAVYTRHPERRSWADIPGAVYTADLEAMLADPEIDVIVVAAPHDVHYSYAKRVLEAGKHCVVEKPFCLSAAQARELFALAEAKGLVLQAYQNRRFDSDFLTAKKVAASGVLGELLEVEMHYDYYRPYVPESFPGFSKSMSYLYGHGCHTLDQVISWLGRPERTYFDVRQLLGRGRMNDYFDVDLYYGTLKVSVKSSYFRVKARPSFVLYGKKGVFVKEKKDRQEEHLKLFYMPEHEDFGVDRPEDYGLLTYYDETGRYHEEKVVSEKGSYACYYDALYETIVNGAPPCVKPEETILLMEYLEQGMEGLD